MSNNIQIPAIKVLCSGLKDQSHIIRHQAKLQRCPLDAGIDLIPSSIDKAIIHPGWSEVWIGTKLHLVFPPGTYGRITDRSSTTMVTGGATVIPGVIDAGYTGEIMVRLQIIHADYILFTEDEWLKPTVAPVAPARLALDKAIADQTPIAQIIATQCLAVAAFQQVDLSKATTNGRGSNGFGSTNNIKT